MKIDVFEVEPWERGVFDRLSDGHQVRFTGELLKADNAADYARAEAISTFIYSEIDRAVLDAMPRLRLIASRSTGVDHIDMATCRERGITVCNVPRYGENTVAEHVFALLLTISHRMEDAINRTRRGEFHARGLQGFDLKGKTLGVIGTGEIGICTIRIARGFGMRVLASDLAPDEGAARDLGFEYVPMNELLARSDIVTLHVPGSKGTRHLIGRAELERMKDGAILINTARGSVVDHRALVRAIAEKKVAAAGLDVLPEEPVVREEAELLRSVYESRHNLDTLLAGQVLTHMRNVIVTPHSAFNTREAVQRILDTTVDNLVAFAAGQPQNVVGED